MNVDKLSMKGWLCLCLCCWASVWSMAQQVHGSVSWQYDPVLLQEFEKMCYRHADIKRATAERLCFDTLSFMTIQLEDFRSQLLYQLSADSVVSYSPNSRVRILQIFQYLPQNVTASRLRQTEQFMDSLSSAIEHGADFNDCVRRFSEDKKEHCISRLEVPVELEIQAFGLKVGEVSKPFYTPMGIHILKVLERMDESDLQQKREVYTQREEKSAFLSWMDELKKKYEYVPNLFNIQKILNRKHTEGELFSLQGESYTATDFTLFAASYPGGSQKQFETFLIKSLLDKAFCGLEQDFPEANAIMQSHRDSLLVREFTKYHFLKEGVGEEANLQAYYIRHRSDYPYKKPKFQGVIIQATTKRVAKQVRKFLKKLPLSEWKDAIRLTFRGQQHSDVRIHEGVFAFGDNPWVDHHIFKQKKVAPLSSHPVVVVMGDKIKYPLDYREVRREVIRDCLNSWENQWISRLKSNK